MRELKFRGWDYVTKQMLPVEKIDFRNDYISLNEGDNSLTDTSEMIGLNQFTGMLDGQGNEIFEGDIVQGRNRMYEDWVIPQKVMYLKGCFMFGNWNAHEYFNKHTEITVIGNVYEHPELLEDKN